MGTKAAFVIPYYGRLPDYFDVWLISATHNPKFDFLFFTDLVYDGELPANVKFITISFDDLKEKIQGLFSFPISLEGPYKFCDFRPAFGLIFQEYLEGYDFWGNCDIDLVFGQIDRFITEDLLASYERIQYMGHFTLNRNIKKVNSLFLKKGSLYSYKRVFSSVENFAFDESGGMFQLALKNGVSQYAARIMVDVSFRLKHQLYACDMKDRKSVV
jgi:hypothetical protein